MVGQSMLEAYKDHPTVPGYIRRALAGETVTYSIEVQELILDVWLGPCAMQPVRSRERWASARTSPKAGACRRA